MNCLKCQKSIEIGGIMQIDFHFCMIYVLSRAVGFNTETSEKIAWASQFVDDCREDIEIRDENGKLIKNHIVTSYNLINPKNFVFEEGFNVWIPFHFLPAGKGDSLPERLICRNATENPYVEKIIENYRSHSFDPIYLGIILHIIVDTFSHQGFSGMLSYRNRIEDVKPPLKSKKSGSKFFNIFYHLWIIIKHIFLEIFSVGHAKANIRPDLPYLSWSYKSFQGEMKKINNVEITEKALFYVYDLLVEEAKKQNIKIKSDRTEIISKIIEKVKEFRIESKAKRYKKWIKAIKNGDFGIKEEVEYRADNVPNDWLLKFHKNATDHKEFVQKEILKDIFAKGYI